MKQTEQIVAALQTVPGLIAATDTPPGQIADNAVAIVYVQSWNVSPDTAMNGNGNLQFRGPVVIRIDIHYARADIATAYGVLESFTDTVPRAIYHAFDKYQKARTLDFGTAPSINQSVVLGSYNGIETLVRRFDVSGDVFGETYRNGI